MGTAYALVEQQAEHTRLTATLSNLWELRGYRNEARLGGSGSRRSSGFVLSRIMFMPTAQRDI
jgi:hypothetical protein